jgi:hypothetical protein
MVSLQAHFSQWGVLRPMPNPPGWLTTPYQLYAATYSMYSQLPSIARPFPPFTIWGRTMLWWQWTNCVTWTVVYIVVMIHLLLFFGLPLCVHACRVDTHIYQACYAKICLSPSQDMILPCFTFLASAVGTDNSTHTCCPCHKVGFSLNTSTSTIGSVIMWFGHQLCLQGQGL